MTDTAATPVLELQDVHAGYEQFKALFGVTLTVRRGQATALIGSNGAGKTTLARVATGLVKPTAGTIRLDGNDVTDARAFDLARLGVAHAPEGRSVFSSLTVEENLALSFRQEKGKAVYAELRHRVWAPPGRSLQVRAGPGSAAALAGACY